MRKLVFGILALISFSAFADDVRDCKLAVSNLYAARLNEALEKLGPPPFDETEEQVKERLRKAEASIPTYLALKNAGYEICQGLGK